MLIPATVNHQSLRKAPDGVCLRGRLFSWHANLIRTTVYVYGRVAFSLACYRSTFFSLACYLLYIHECMYINWPTVFAPRLLRIYTAGIFTSSRGYVMKAFVLYILAALAALAGVVCLSLASSPARAAEVLAYTDESAGIMLHDSACLNADLVEALTESVPGSKPQHADVDYKNLRVIIPACWVFDGADKIILADEMGNAGFILRSQFKTVHAF